MHINFNFNSVGNCASLEKLKCIPGFVPELTLSQMNQMLVDIGCFIGYSSDLNIPETKMRDISQSVGTISSPQLDLARSFSLSAACGTQFYLGDLKCFNAGSNKQAFSQAQDVTNLAKTVIKLILL